jgi:predicted phosphate transport protein (TIGR00153 family)
MSTSAHYRFGIFSRGENEVLKLVVTNLDFSIETARGLIKLVDSLKNHDKQTALSVAKSIGDMETRADSMHQKAIEDISSGSFFGGIREDLLEMLEDIDNIADAAKDSSRVFSQRDIPLDVIDYLFERDVRSFVDKLIETDEALKVAVLALGEKDAKTRVVELATKVERKEEEADEIRASILDNLLKNDVKADPLDIIMLKEFLEIADDVADGAEDASDVLLVLIAKGYT